MNHPKSNPFNTKMTEVVLTKRELSRDNLVDIVAEFFGDDAVVLSVHTQLPAAWVRVRGYWELTQEYTDFWAWVSNDSDEWLLNAQAARM